MSTSIGSMIDGLYDLRAQRLAIEKQVEELKASETATKEEILFLLKESGLEGAKGEVATASIQYKIKPNVTDWDAVYTYIRENDMFALLQKRLTTTLWSALAEDGITVPGTEPIPIVDLSLTKSKRA
jgi:hypothetical protein